MRLLFLSLLLSATLLGQSPSLPQLLAQQPLSGLFQVQVPWTSQNYTLGVRRCEVPIVPGVDLAVYGFWVENPFNHGTCGVVLANWAIVPPGGPVPPMTYPQTPLTSQTQGNLFTPIIVPSGSTFVLDVSEGVTSVCGVWAQVGLLPHQLPVTTTMVTHIYRPFVVEVITPQLFLPPDFGLLITSIDEIYSDPWPSLGTVGNLAMFFGPLPLDPIVFATPLVVRPGQPFFLNPTSPQIWNTVYRISGQVVWAHEF